MEEEEFQEIQKFQEFNELLENPSNNILVDIHSCPIERGDVATHHPAHDGYFTQVPRGIYVVLISDFGQDKVGENNVQDLDMNMYADPNWVLGGDSEIIKAAQLYFPLDKIFNPLMMFGIPGEYDENYDIFNVKTGKAASFNKSDKSLQGKWDHMTYSRRVLLGKIRDNEQKIVYIPTCDPTGKKPHTWLGEWWNEISNERLFLQKQHRNKFKNFVNWKFGEERISLRNLNIGTMGRDGEGLHQRMDGKNDWEFHKHFMKSVSGTPVEITHESISDPRNTCEGPCEYKKSCTNNIPLVGAIAKFCQNKYCKLEDKTIGICQPIPIGGKRKTKKKRRKTRKRRRRKKKRSRKKRKKKKRTKEKGRK